MIPIYVIVSPEINPLHLIVAVGPEEVVKAQWSERRIPPGPITEETQFLLFLRFSAN